jgi:hypothetical protein
VKCDSRASFLAHTFASPYLGRKPKARVTTVKVSNCKLWNPLRISPGIAIPQGCTLVTDGLHILGVPVSFQDFATHFLDEVLSQDVAHLDDLLLLGNAQVILSILSSCVTYQTSYFTWIIPPSFLSLLVGFNESIMQVCVPIINLKSWESFKGP